jgi:Na+/citrate or Na+/malate symporter
MDLMPFAAYSSRIGGSLVLVLAGVLVTLLKLV